MRRALVILEQGLAAIPGRDGRQETWDKVLAVGGHGWDHRPETFPLPSGQERNAPSGQI